MAVYITGDCHGSLRKIKLLCMEYDTCLEDVLVVLGDFSVNYSLGEKDMARKEELSKLPITILAIHGNHDARPGDLEQYKEVKWKEGTVYIEEKFPNILFAKDGEIFRFGDKQCIAIGGAYSVDKNYRLLTGLPWFKNEQPSEEIKQYVEEQLQAVDWHVDYVFSHTCPLKYEPSDLSLEFISQDTIDKSTEEWLSDIERKMEYKKWYFGHFHENREYWNAEMLFEAIKELGTDKTMIRVGRPIYKKGEFVSFDFNNGKEKTEMYGKITIIDAYGTLGQNRKVSYDILGSDGDLYKHIPESDVYGFKD